MALYDSSQLINIINNANAYLSNFYPTFNSTGGASYGALLSSLGGTSNPLPITSSTSSNPFGPFNDVSFLKSRYQLAFNPSSNLNLSSNSSSMKFDLSGDLHTPSFSAGQWSRYGYNAAAGQRLASVARNNSVGFTGYCARYVKTAIRDAGLGKYEYGHAYQMDDILRRNNNFREIPANTDVKSLPAGCVIVFNQGSKGYSRSYGHIEITDGNGRGISDGITRNLRQPDAIFMPVAA
jgi:hypothetical protein